MSDRKMRSWGSRNDFQDLVAKIEETVLDIVARLLLREEIDCLEHELSQQKAAPNPDFARVQLLKQDIEKLERRLAANGANTQPRRAG